MRRIMVYACGLAVRETASDLPLPCRQRLGAVDVLVLFLPLGGVKLAQEIGRGGNVVPAAVLEIDQGLAVVVDRDDPADSVAKAFQLDPIGIDDHVLVDPLGAEL